MSNNLKIDPDAGPLAKMFAGGLGVIVIILVLGTLGLGVARWLLWFHNWLF